MKDKTIKFRLSEESAATLEKLAKELGKSKSEIIRNGLPAKISSAAFDDLLSIQNLTYLEIKANQCVSNLEKGIALKLDEIKEQYPAYIFKEKDQYFLQVKYPTLKINLNNKINQQEVNEILWEYKKSIMVYSNQVFVLADGNHHSDFRECILCLDKDLFSNYDLAKSIISTLSDKGLSSTVMPSYYIKPYKLKTDSSEEYALGFI